MIYYSLHNPISSEKLVNDLNKLLSKFSSEEISHKILVIKLMDITTYTGDSPLPKITYEESQEKDQKS